MNTIGKILTLTTFGESHGPAMGGVLDGMPAGVEIDLEELQRFVARRRTGQTVGASSRDEKDRVEVLSGIWQGKTLGTPIGFIVRNNDARSNDYDEIARCYRPNHADFTWKAKYGIRDPRGGGRASARETVARVVAGGMAIQFLKKLGITIQSRIVQVGPHRDVPVEEMERVIAEAASQGDTLGGIISCTVQGVPAGGNGGRHCHPGRVGSHGHGGPFRLDGDRWGRGEKTHPHRRLQRAGHPGRRRTGGG